MEKGELTVEEAANRMIALREKPSAPEELSSEHIERDLCFKDDYLNHVSEERAEDQRHLQERNETIRQLQDSLSELQNSLDEEKEHSHDKQKQIDELTEKLEKLEAKERQKQQTKEKRKSLAKLVLSIVWKLTKPVLLALVIRWICIRLQLDYGTWIGVGIGLIPLVALYKGSITKEINEYKKKSPT